MLHLFYYFHNMYLYCTLLLDVLDECIHEIRTGHFALELSIILIRLP